MGCAVRQFEKEASLRLGTGVENVTSNFMGRAVRQFDKEVSFKLGKGVEVLHRTVWDAPSASSKRKLVLAINRSRICLELYGTRRPPREKKLVLNRKQN